MDGKALSGFSACGDQSQAIKQYVEAIKAMGFYLILNFDVPTEEVRKASEKAFEFFRPPVEEKLDSYDPSNAVTPINPPAFELRKCKDKVDSDDPSNAETPSTVFIANQETSHKNVTEGVVNPPAFEIELRKCKDKVDSDDPSNAETPSTVFIANQETSHKNVTEGVVNPPAFEIE